MRRVDEAVREVLADAIGRLLRDPRVGFVTVTSAHGVLQAEVGRQLRMKRTPTLEFRLDHTTENAFKMDALIAEVAPGGEETQA